MVRFPDRAYRGPPQIMYGGGVVNTSHIPTSGIYQHGMIYLYVSTY